MDFKKQFIRIRRLAVVRHLIGLLVTFGLMVLLFMSPGWLWDKGPFAVSLASKINAYYLWYFYMDCYIADKLTGVFGQQHPELEYAVIMVILLTTVNYAAFLALRWFIRFCIKLGRNRV